MSAGVARLRDAGILRRVDAALGAWVTRAFPDTAPEVALAAALVARAVADGHSALTLDAAAAWLARIAGDGRPPELPAIESWCEALRQSPAVHPQATGMPPPATPLVLDPQRRIYLRRYFEYERQVAASLIARAALPTDDSFTGAAPQAGNGGAHHARVPGSKVDPEQQRAIDVALAHRFTLVTGGPGTGKTHSVVRMLAALARRAHRQGRALRIALAAPTGKAAARMAEAVRGQLGQLDLPDGVRTLIPRDAATVHRLLGMSPWRTRPRFDHAAPLPFDVVVVDEVSMVDLPLMARLVDAVPLDARLILLGDPDQLSAVEAGNVLGALVNAAAAGPLDACHVALTHSHRFDPASGMGALADAIARGDGDAATAACTAGPDVKLAEGAHRRQLVDVATDAYREVVAADGPDRALRAARGFRVLTALRRGPAGCVALDQAIAARLQRIAGVRADERWWRGRLILVTANRDELGLFNGDTGLIWPDADGAMQAWFEGDDGARPLPVAALPPHEGAFALTVHKAQGSEFGYVALVTGPDSAVLTRELLYTGVTRARTGVTLYTATEVLRAGIGKRSLRMTGLADRLREAAAV